MKSDIEIKDAIFGLLKGSALESAVTGKLSKRGRPLGSGEEDIVVSVVENGTGQLQEALVDVNIYVRDVLNAETGGFEVNNLRCRELCDLSKFLFSSRWDDFRVDMTESKQRVFKLECKDEHIINNQLLISISNN